MTDLRNLIIGKGSEAALAVDKAKANVEDARAGIEEAKQRLEEAKSHLSDMNTAFDNVLSEMEAAGLSKGKARRAIEEINQTLVAIGAIAGEDAVSVVLPSTEKPARRKRKEKTDETEEDTKSTSGDAEASAETAMADTRSEVVEQPVVVEVSEQPSGADLEVEVDEINELIVESTVDFDASRVELVRSILKYALSVAYNVASNEGAQVDLDYFRTFLTDIARDPEQDTFKGDVYNAFVNVITAVENQESEISFVLLPAEEETNNNSEDYIFVDSIFGGLSTEIVESAEETVVEPVEDEVGIDDLEKYSGDDDEMVDDYEDYQMDDESHVSDDATFPISGDNEVSSDAVSVIDNIDNMNFLEEVQPSVDIQKDKSVENKTPEASIKKEESEKPSEEAQKARKPFAPPPFLKR